MKSLTTLSIPELGAVSLDQNVSLAVLGEAEKLVEMVSEADKTGIFIDYVLASMFVQPEMSPSQVRSLSDEATSVLITSVADILSVNKEFDNLPAYLSPQEKLYKAIYQHLADPLAKIALPVIYTAQIPAQLAKATEPLKTISEQVTAQIVQNMEAIQSVISLQVRDTLESITDLGKQFATLGKEVNEKLDAVKVDANTVAPLLAEANLWLPPGTLDVLCDLMPRLKALIDKGYPTPEMVEEVFFQYFEENDWKNLKKRVSAWKDNPHFADRMPIIWDALDAHASAKYTLSIPAILPQVEGVASSILSRSVNRRTGTQISNMLQSHLPEFLRAASRDILIRFVTDIAYVRTNFNDFIADLAAKGFAESDFMNRHSILHGVQINYANKGLSLKAFLLLDALSIIK